MFRYKISFFICLFPLFFVSCFFPGDEIAFDSKKITEVKGVWEVSEHVRELDDNDYQAYQADDTISTTYPESGEYTFGGQSYSYEIRLYIYITSTKMYFIKNLSGSMPENILSEMNKEFGFTNGIRVTSESILIDDHLKVANTDNRWNYKVSGEYLVLKNWGTLSEKYVAVNSDKKFGDEIDKTYDLIGTKLVSIEAEPSRIMLNADLNETEGRYRADLLAGHTYYVYGYTSTEISGASKTTDIAMTVYSNPEFTDLLSVSNEKVYSNYLVKSYTPSSDQTIYVLIASTSSSTSYGSYISTSKADTYFFCGISESVPEDDSIKKITLNQTFRYVADDANTSSSQNNSKDGTFYLKIPLESGRKYWITNVISQGYSWSFPKSCLSSSGAAVSIGTDTVNLTTGSTPSFIAISESGIYYFKCSADSDIVADITIYDSRPDLSTAYTLGTPVDMSFIKTVLITFVPTKSSIKISTNDGTDMDGSLIDGVTCKEVTNGNLYYTETKTISVTPGVKYYLRVIASKAGPTTTMTVTE